MGIEQKTLKVKTTGSEYSIFIGEGILPEVLSGVNEKFTEPAVAVISSTVYRMHSDYIKSALKIYPAVNILEMDDTELNKNYFHAALFFNRMIDHKLNRNSCVVAIGGGVVGDFSGFLAALYMRGIPVVHVPTTLLAMVDSSVGGKTAVNIDRGKNIIGAFHQPSLVVSDVAFLKTLPFSELKNGLAEALKHALIGDSKTFEILMANDRKAILKEENLINIAYFSASFKAKIVTKDERERGLRAILNFGHTVGHALESFMKYTGISHGEAVAFGIAVKARACNIMGGISDDELSLINDLINRYGLIEKKIEVSPDDLLKHMQYDKKNRSGTINYVGLDGIGKPLINMDIKPAIIREAVNETIIWCQKNA